MNDEVYSILLHFVNLLAEKTDTDGTTILLLLAGIGIPVILWCYALLSYMALFILSEKRKGTAVGQFAFICVTLILLVGIGGLLIYSCL